MEEHANSSAQAQAQAQGQSLSQSQLQSQAEISQYVGRDLIHGDGFSWSPEKENIVKGPYDYLEAHPGKDVRSQLINAFNLWLQVPEPSLAIINKVIGMLHTASLLIDDVEDNSNLRRGVPVAHHIFGTAQTINSANYVYFCALQEIAKLNNPEAIQIYTDELLNLHRGQGMDLFWRDTLTCPSEDDYLEMVGNKTGGLFRLAIKLMHACSPSHNTPSSPTNNQTSYVPLVNTIGLLFHALMYAGQPAIMAEMFPTRMRYSGVSLGYQVTSIVAGSLAPIIATTLLRDYGSSTPVAVYLLLACCVTVVAVLVLKETRGISLQDVDEADARGTADLLANSKK